MKLYFEFSKIKHELGDLLGSKNPIRGKFTLTLLPINQKNELVQLEKRQQVKFGEKSNLGN